MTRERRLGRGLEALLGRPVEGIESEAPTGDDWHAGVAPEGLPLVNVFEIDANPYQPRRDFDEAEIASLADSLGEHGLLQPLVLRRAGERYQLVAGERRLRAAIRAGWSQVPAQIREVDDRQAAEIAIVENLQRKDLNAMEKAASFRDYLQRYGCTQDELAGRLKIDRSTVANLVRLLELPHEVQDAVRRGLISQGHARALLPLGEEREQVDFCLRIQEEALSVRATEELVGRHVYAADAPPPLVDDHRTDPQPTARRPPARSEHLAMLEQELKIALGTKVDIRPGARGRGRIVVHFNSHDEFERLRHSLARGSLGDGRAQAG